MTDIQQIIQQARLLAIHAGSYSATMDNSYIFVDDLISISADPNSQRLWVSVYHPPANGEFVDHDWLPVLDLDSTGCLNVWQSFTLLHGSEQSWVEYVETLYANLGDRSPSFNWRLAGCTLFTTYIESAVEELKQQINQVVAYDLMLRALENCSQYFQDKGLATPAVDDEFESDAEALLKEIQTAIAFAQGEIGWVGITADTAVAVDDVEADLWA